MEDKDNCPNCNASFIGDPIPEDIVSDYMGTHWRNEIGIDGSHLGIYDGIVAFKCHNCGYEFPRGNSDWALSLFNKYLERKNEL
jgi:hypothetical protein